MRETMKGEVDEEGGHQRTLDDRFYWYRNFNTLLLTWFAYCAFVASRRPYGIVRSTVEQHTGLGRTHLGVIDSGFLTAYTVGQFFYGEVKAYLSPRETISFGLVCCSVAISCFAWSESFFPLLVFWSLNGLFNAFGWPSCMRIITPWIRPQERGRIMGIWASCQAAGGIIGTTSAAYFLNHYGWSFASFQSAFFVLLVGVANGILLYDHPSRLGYPAQDEGGTASSSTRMSAREVLQVPGITPVAMAHFCEKIIRYTLLFWLPYYLTQHLKYHEVISGYVATSFDVGGVIGSVASGLVADWWGEGRRRTTVSAAFLAGAGLSLTAFTMSGPMSADIRLPSAVAFLVGFLLMGFDSLLTGAVIQDLATNANVPQHVSAISGVIGGSGSFGSILSGMLTSEITKLVGWDFLWIGLFGLAAIAVLSLSPTIRKEMAARGRH